MPNEIINRKRTTIDYSNHVVNLRKNDDVSIIEFKKPNTIVQGIMFIYSCGIMAVTGDFGNWIFCRQFYPSPDGYVSDGYWTEKLEINSEQKGTEYDAEGTYEELIRMIKIGAEEYGYEGEKLKKMISYYEDCLSKADDESNYTQYAYNKYPDFADYDCVVYLTKTKRHLECIFDAFEEICRRMREDGLVF